MIRRNFTRLGLATGIIAATVAVGVPLASGVAHAADSGTCPTPAGSYAGGSGTGGDPYLIATPGQLQLLRDTSADWSAAVALTDDIDMGGCVWGTTLGDTRVTTWTGDFDGGGHVVSGLDIVLSGTGYAGFIAYLGTGSSLTGLGFTGDVSVTTTGTGSVFGYAGGLVGFTLGVPISDSYATGAVDAQVTASGDGSGNATAYTFVGGLVGVSQGSVDNSYATGSLNSSAVATATGSGSASAYVLMGGLIADKAVSTVTNSYATGSMTHSETVTGGSSQSTNLRIGGFAGEVNGGTTVTGGAWNLTTSGESSAVGLGSSTGITGLTSTQMQETATFGRAGLDWSIGGGYSPTTAWSMCQGLNSGYPVLTSFASAADCSGGAYAVIDAINTGGAPDLVVIAGQLTASSTDDTIYVADDSQILVYPPLANSQDSAAALAVGKTIQSVAVTDDTMYVATGDGSGNFLLAYPVGATGAASPSASNSLTPEPSAIAVGGQGTSGTEDDSVYLVAYNAANGIYQFSPTLDDSAYTPFTENNVQPGAIQVSGASTLTTTDDTVIVRGNGYGTGDLVSLTPSLDDSVSIASLGFGGTNFLLFDDSLLYSSYNGDRFAPTADPANTVAVDWGSVVGAVNGAGAWLGVNLFSGTAGIGPVTSAARTSVVDLGYPNGYRAWAAAASDRTFYVVGGQPQMSIVDAVFAGQMSPTTGAWGTPVSLPYLTGSGRLADDSTVTGVTWAGTSIPFTRTAGRNAVEVAVPDVYGTAEVVLELNGGTQISLGDFAGPAEPRPTPPTPAGAPTKVSAVAGDASVDVTWQAPDSAGSYAITQYQVEGSPSGSCLVSSAETECVIENLVNGTAYRFRARALTGAGWGVWSTYTDPVVPRAEAIVITGSRAGREVRVEGMAPAFVGAEVTPWLRFPGEGSYSAGVGVRTVAADGTFAWRRDTGKKVYVYFRASETQRSNRVILPARNDSAR